MNLFTNKSFVSVKKPLNIVISTSIWLASLAASPFAISEARFESIENISHSAKIFLEKTTNAADNPYIEVWVNKIDPRLRVKKCDSELQASFPMSRRNNGKAVVTIHCEGPVAWKINVSASIKEYADVIVATKTLPRHSPIGKSDIQIKKVDISTFRKQPLMSLNRVLGSTPIRYLRNGSVIFEDSICMVCRGERVKVLAENQFFNIDLEGVALANATLGETTQIRNSQSKRSFDAKVIGYNLLEVSL